MKKDIKQEVWLEYIDMIKNFTSDSWLKYNHSFKLFHDVMDTTIIFCEDNNLIVEFIACKFNPVAFYAYARYKVGLMPLEELEYC